MGTVVAIKEAKEQEVLRSYLEAKAQLAFWKKQEAEAKSLLQSWIPAGESVAIGDKNVRHDVAFRKGLDTDTLKKDLPELWTEYSKTSEVHKLVIA